MTAPANLRTLILSSTSVAALVGTRCHYNHTPEASACPRIWFRISSDTEERTMDGVGGLHQAETDLECAGVTETSAQSLADAVKGKLDGFKGAMGTMTAQAMFLRDKDDDYVPFLIQGDEGVHVISFTLSMWYTT